jgi:protein phosphatase
VHLYAWACTDVGRKRKDNQDAFLIAHDLKLLAVADGMGGHKGGEVASALAVETLEQDVRARAASGGAHALADAVTHANARIHAAGSADPNLEQMGTTASALWLRGARATIAHVGDSRVYLLRGGKLTQLTDDHSFVFQQVRAGLISEEQAKRSPYKNVLTRSVGVEPRVEVDVLEVELRCGDALVLCSDGLCGVVPDEEIEAVVRDNFAYLAPRLLVERANARGGPDNITVVVACALEGGSMAP